MDDDGFGNEAIWTERGQMMRGQPAPGPYDNGHFRIDWVDRGRDPVSPPNPAYPEGCAIDVALDAVKTCRVALPYPAARCGVLIVRCLTCAYSVALTTAGRPDDPRTARLPCRRPL